MSNPSPDPESRLIPQRSPNRRTRALIIAALALITVGLLLKGLLTPAAPSNTTASATPGPTAPAAGHYAPDITLRDLSNNPVKLSSLKGKVVALNFWYAACEPCKLEMPALQRAYTQYQSQGLVVLGVDIVDDPATADTFVHAVGVTYPVVRDVDLRAATIYRVTDTPSTFFIDRDGVVRYRVVGALDATTLHTDVTALLSQKP
ncbi:MAG TPA: TlpA disulfide reductase family protein [Ktedonobacterales bacterium]|jgi:peroxiredoxin|nr:TlpA disulfide reductase family protein [Ktedonobacterales bacterium]